MSYNFDVNEPRQVVSNTADARFTIPGLFHLLREMNESLANSIDSEYQPLGWELQDVYFRSKKTNQPYIVRLLPGDSLAHPFWTGPASARLQNELVVSIREQCPKGINFSPTRANPSGLSLWREEEEEEEQD